LNLKHRAIKNKNQEKQHKRKLNFGEIKYGKWIQLFSRMNKQQILSRLQNLKHLILIYSKMNSLTTILKKRKEVKALMKSLSLLQLKNCLLWIATVNLKQQGEEQLKRF